MSLGARSSFAFALVVSACCLGGCLERRLHITSEPPGALVHLNDVEVGRTPCEVDFEFYGVYDVRLELRGFEPLMTSAEAKAPAHELPVVDLAALVAPIRFTNDVRWHFVLSPAADDTDALLERARELRHDLDSPPADAPGATPGDDRASSPSPGAF